MAHRESNGAVLYRGPSLLTGGPIVAIVTGLATPSTNPKTGPMLQTWILPDGDASPLSHVRAGTDRVVCGTCPFASGRGCYVQVANGPGAVWRAYRAGRYLDLSGDAADGGFAIAGTCADHAVRLGAYGDPCAVPVDVWEAVTRFATGHTGYTHQWRQAQFAPWREYLQASCETAGDVARARTAGWGVFAVIPEALESTVPAIVCPASDEAGKGTTCAECGLCDGRSGNIVRIRPHGSKARAAALVSLTRGGYA